MRWELHTDEPMLPMEQFADRRFSMGTGTIGLIFFAMFGTFFVSTQYLQFVLDYSPFEAGLATLPMAAMMILIAPRAPGFAERYGRDKVMAVGLTTVAVGLFSLSLLDVDTPYVQLAIGLMLLGGGMSLTTAPATGAVMESMPLAKAGVGSAVNDTSREVGGALGVAILGSILSSGYRSHLDLDLSAAPPEAAAVIKEGVGSALGVADQGVRAGDIPAARRPSRSPRRPSRPSPTPCRRCSGPLRRWPWSPPCWCSRSCRAGGTWSPTPPAPTRPSSPTSRTGPSTTPTPSRSSPLGP